MKTIKGTIRTNKTGGSFVWSLATPKGSFFLPKTKYGLRRFGNKLIIAEDPNGRTVNFPTSAREGQGNCFMLMAGKHLSRWQLPAPSAPYDIGSVDVNIDTAGKLLSFDLTEEMLNFPVMEEQLSGRPPEDNSLSPKICPEFTDAAASLPQLLAEASDRVRKAGGTPVIREDGNFGAEMIVKTVI